MTDSFDKSRRLIGPNLYFTECGVALDVGRPYVVDAEREAIWRARIATARKLLGWPDAPTVARHHRDGTHLALAAPVDQLYPATDVNEWAWLEALENTELKPGEAPPVKDTEHTLERIEARSERNVMLGFRALMREAARRGIPVLHGDDDVTIGYGCGSRTWDEDELPRVSAVPWDYLHGVPAVLVTGTNGKTTTVRLLSAMAREAGLIAGYNCTDGLVVNGKLIGKGDYSGPAGTRHILRNRQVELAVLETARGGILRRGLALEHADVGIVTNITADHLGERGIHDLEGLADTKLVIARALKPGGLLILNADDPTLMAKSPALPYRLGWFAHDDACALLAAYRSRGGSTCAVKNGRMRLHLPARDIDADLGAVVDMPLSVNGRAGYNISNLLGAAMAAAELGIPVPAIRAVLSSFGRANQDNPGRLQRWQLGEVQVFVDYAHNPDGLSSLLKIAISAPYKRLAIAIGQAGNREDAEIRELAATAASFKPDRVLLKTLGSHSRGRAVGEVSRLLSAELNRHGVVVSEASIDEEIDAVREALAWAQEGDVLVLPIHTSSGRELVCKLMDQLVNEGWRAGCPLPAATEATVCATPEPSAANDG